VLIAIKEDPNGQFVSRDAALEYMQIMQSIRGFPASDDALELLRALEWSGNLTDYEDSWGMITIACPSCHNAKKDGHKPGCKLSNIITHREEKP
ncbi:MAG: hypothetical protein M0Q91_12785, partial [Methanoregula sp.]|nr:hypothetical protein [Methanoregula sp.]